MKKNTKILIITIIILEMFSILFLQLIFNNFYENKNASIDIPKNSNKQVEAVYIILIDGLRYDTVLKDMYYLKEIIYNKKALLKKIKITGPSYSRPAYARIFTGTPTIVNGIWNNNQSGPCKITSLFENVKQTGLSTGACSYYWIGQLFNKKVLTDRFYFDVNENIQYSFFYSDENTSDEYILNNSLIIIEKFKPNLFLIHFMECDIVGHKFGGLSVQYSKIAENTDKLIKKFISIIDIQKSAVLIISDHGHKDNGGHGGNSPSEIEIPIILAGKLTFSKLFNTLTNQEDITPFIYFLFNIP